MEIIITKKQAVKVVKSVWIDNQKKWALFLLLLVLTTSVNLGNTI